MHICSKMNPNVFMCSFKESGVCPNAATAMDGSQKQRFTELRMAVLLRIEGHQASMS